MDKRQFKTDAKKNERKFYTMHILKVVHTYGPYESFGELALLTNKRRAAKLEVVGHSDAHFAILDKRDYKQIQYKIQTAILKEKTLFLRNFQMFKGISDSFLSGLTYYMEEMICSRGQVIYSEDNDISNSLYLVKSGEFKCTKKLANVPATEKEILSTLLIEEAAY